MKINILYFTSTGNSLWMSEKTAEYFEQAGHEVNLFDCVTNNESCLEGADIIGLCFPVWGSIPPHPMRPIINKMQEGKGQKVFIFANAAAISGDTEIMLKNHLEEKGYHVVSAHFLLLPINCIIPWFTIFKMPDQMKQESMKKQAESQLKLWVGKILSGEDSYGKTSTWHKFIGWLQYNNFDSLVNWMSKQMFIDQKACNQCGLCYHFCPQAAIEFNEAQNVYSINGEKCTFCLKCYNYCPQTAALFLNKKSRNTQKYKRFTGLLSYFKPLNYR